MKTGIRCLNWLRYVKDTNIDLFFLQHTSNINLYDATQNIPDRVFVGHEKNNIIAIIKTSLYNEIELILISPDIIIFSLYKKILIIGVYFHHSTDLEYYFNIINYYYSFVKSGFYEDCFFTGDCNATTSPSDRPSKRFRKRDKQFIDWQTRNNMHDLYNFFGTGPIYTHRYGRIDHIFGTKNFLMQTTEVIHSKSNSPYVNSDHLQCTWIPKRIASNKKINIKFNNILLNSSKFKTLIRKTLKYIGKVTPSSLFNCWAKIASFQQYNIDRVDTLETRTNYKSNFIKEVSRRIRYKFPTGAKVNNHEELVKAWNNNTPDPPNDLINKWNYYIPTLTNKKNFSFKITKKDIIQAIDSAKKDKTPGPNGIDIKFFSTFKRELSYTLKYWFNDIINGEMPETEIHFLKRGNLLYIPKKPDSEEARPLTMLNTIWKLFTSIIYTKIKPIENNILHKDQIGFRKNRWIQECHILVKLALSEGIKTLFVDFAKAFDRVQHKWIKLLFLKCFGKKWHNLINALLGGYSSIINTKYRNETIILTSGVRQGCPLSPFLFNLAIAPLLYTIKINFPDIYLPKANTFIGRTPIFADDFTFFYTKKSEEKKFFNLLNQFKILSGLDIHKGKCIAFNDPYSKYYSNSSHKYLGILYNPNRTIEWNYIINYIKHSRTIQK